jgi:hypothetical protein
MPNKGFMVAGLHPASVGLPTVLSCRPASKSVLPIRVVSRLLEESYLESVPWSVVGQEPSFVEKGYT